jgi:hypothetical protein
MKRSSTIDELLAARGSGLATMTSTLGDDGRRTKMLGQRSYVLVKARYATIAGLGNVVSYPSLALLIEYKVGQV